MESLLRSIPARDHAEPLNPVQQKPAIVILPGLWHFSAIYESFCELLRAEGYDVVSVENPSAGAEPPTKSLVHDSSAARVVLETLVNAGREVIMLGHSYGGLVGQNSVYGLSATERAKDDQPGGVIAFIYLAAFVGLKYNKMSSYLHGVNVSWMKIDGQYVSCTDPISAFFHDVDNAERLLVHVTHSCASSFNSAILYEPWHHIRCTYIACTKDGGLPYELQRKMASQIPKVTIVDLPSSHSPFLSMPDRVIDIIKNHHESSKEEESGGI